MIPAAYVDAFDRDPCDWQLLAIIADHYEERGDGRALALRAAAARRWLPRSGWGGGTPLGETWDWWTVEGSGQYDSPFTIRLSGPGCMLGDAAAAAFLPRALFTALQPYGHGGALSGHFDRLRFLEFSSKTLAMQSLLAALMTLPAAQLAEWGRCRR